MTPAPVVVVGAGPTGVTAALALAQLGVENVLLERRTEIHPLPRAVHLDDEAVRVLQGLGLAGAFAGISRPGLGLRLLDAEHRTMAEFRRGTGAYGHPQANLFDQPELERVLRAELAHRPSAQLRSGVEVIDVAPGAAGGPAAVTVRELVTGHSHTLAAAAVLGCDGAGSRVRQVVGARWQDLRFTERWLVVDVRCPVPLGAWAGVHQLCDPDRAATFLQVGEDRYRWEFALRDDESVDDLLHPPVLAALVAPWTRGVPVERLEVLRSSEYVFRARLADRWRQGRVFLLGDAAHQTPPFVGQGLAAGVRDASNLAWKLAAVLQGRAPEDLLDSYELERRPHARALIRQAVTAGWAMTGGGGRTAAVRRRALAAFCRVPTARDRVLDRGTPALRPGPLVPRRWPGGERLAGTLLPQPRVRQLHRELLLDDALGPGFAVLTSAAPDPALREIAAALGAGVWQVGGHELRADDGTLLVDADATVARWLESHRTRTVVVRPDRVVLVSDRSPAAPGAALRARSAAVLALAGARAGAPA